MAPSLAHALIGDVNGDGKVDLQDARLVANYLVGNSTALPHPENADVNGDGKITTADALEILQIAKGLRTAFYPQPLRVLTVVPSTASTNVLLTASISVFFSGPVLATSLTGFSVIDSSGNPVAGSMQISQDGVIATFVPNSVLLPSSSYSIVLSTAVADNSGNPLKQAFSSSFKTQAIGSATLLSVNNSTAAIGAVLAQPITVKLTNPDGSLAVGSPVVFSAQMGNGSFQPSGLRQLTVLTDPNGLASATYQAGSQALQNSIAISAVGFSPIPVFSVTTMPTPAVNLRLYTGDNQRGAPGETSMFPLVVQATDVGGDSIAGTTVTFAVTQGQGTFGGQPTATAVTDSSGTASTNFTFGSTTGTVIITASFPGMVGLAPRFTFNDLLPQPSSPTVIVGHVLDAQTLLPLTHIYVYLADTPSIWDWSDQNGFFFLATTPGHHVVEADGFQSGPINNVLYPVVSIPVNAVQGQNNDIGMPALLPQLDVQSYLDVSDVVGGTLTIRSNPLWQLYVAPGSAHFVNGTTTGRLYAAAVPPDKIPMPVAGGKSSRFIDTIQPLNVQFNPPAPVTFPNADNLAPGTVTEIFTLSYASGTFLRTGRGKVSEDGKLVASLPGEGITSGGWHLTPDPGPQPPGCVNGTVTCKGCSNVRMTINGITDACTPTATPDIWHCSICGLTGPGPFNPIFNAGTGGPTCGGPGPGPNGNGGPPYPLGGPPTSGPNPNPPSTSGLSLQLTPNTMSVGGTGGLTVLASGNPQNTKIEIITDPNVLIDGVPGGTPINYGILGAVAAVQGNVKGSYTITAQVPGSNTPPAAATLTVTDIPTVQVTNPDVTHDNITVTLAPPNLTGSLTLQLTGPTGNTDTIETVDRNSGSNKESFNIPNLIEGEYTQVTANWTVAGVSASGSTNYHIQVLGLYHHTQYNSPSEAACAPAVQQAYITNNSCAFTSDSLRSAFVSQTDVNGNGTSMNHGLVQVEDFCFRNPPTGGVPSGAIWNHNSPGSGNAFRPVTSIIGSCPPLVITPGQTVAVDPAALGQGHLLPCGTRVYINTPGGGVVKTVADACPACRDGHHMDNFAASTACSAHAVGDLAPTQLMTVKLFDQ